MTGNHKQNRKGSEAEDAACLTFNSSIDAKQQVNLLKRLQ